MKLSRKMSAIMTMPPVLYRWMDDDQADLLLCGGGLIPSWTHLMPDTCRLEKGICFGEDAWRWKEEHEYTVCIALSTDGLPENLRLINVDGDMLFAAGIKHHHLRKDARSEVNSEKKAALQTEARSVAESLRKAHVSGVAVPDEWVMRGPIPNALEHVVGMVVLTSASRRIQRLAEQGVREEELKFPVERVSSRIDGDPDLLESEMRRVFGHLIKVEPGGIMPSFS
jgi:hypothetical protein